MSPADNHIHAEATAPDPALTDPLFLCLYVCLFVSCFFIFISSPNKTEFIKAKYQMLAFVHRMPCRDDDSFTAKDLSKVRGENSVCVSEIVCVCV